MVRQTYHLSCACALLDVLSELLLLLFELGTLAIELTLRLLQGSLMLSESFCWSLGPAKE